MRPGDGDGGRQGVGGDVTIAAVSALCLDAADVRRAGEFWAAVLGAPLVVREDGVAVIRSATLPDLWIDPVPEPKVIKNRVHLNLRAPSVDGLLGLGATELDDQDTFRVLADPEGNELCVFPGPAPAVGLATPFALCVDSDRPEHVAAWWQGLLGGTIVPGPDGTPRWIDGAAGLRPDHEVRPRPRRAASRTGCTGTSPPPISPP